MSILNKKVKVIVTGATKPYYLSLGYEVPKINKYGYELEIDIIDLPLRSMVLVDVECDFDDCSNVKQMKYFNYNSYLERNGCFACDKCRDKIYKKKRLEECRNFLLNLNCELLSKEYVDNHTPLKFKTEDGYVVNMSWGNLKKGKNFRGGIFSSRNVDSIYNIKLWLIKNNITLELLSKYNNGNKKKLLWKCLKHPNEEPFERTWSGVFSGKRTGCSKCFRETFRLNRGLTFKEVERRCKKANNKTKLLTAPNEYENTQTYLRFRCLECGYDDWHHKIGNFERNPKCPNCGDNYYVGNPEGFYSVHRAEKEKEDWIKVPCILYLIRCWNDDELFYKIGITINSIEKRFPSKTSMPYNYELIGEIKTNRYEAIRIEHDMHKCNKDNKFEPKIFFAGHNECFSEVDLGEYSNQFKFYD